MAPFKIIRLLLVITLAFCSPFNIFADGEGSEPIGTYPPSGNGSGGNGGRPKSPSQYTYTMYYYDGEIWVEEDHGMGNPDEILTITVSNSAFGSITYYTALDSPIAVPVVTGTYSVNCSFSSGPFTSGQFSLE